MLTNKDINEIKENLKRIANFADIISELKSEGAEVDFIELLKEFSDSIGEVV